MTSPDAAFLGLGVDPGVINFLHTSYSTWKRVQHLAIGLVMGMSPLNVFSFRAFLAYILV